MKKGITDGDLFISAIIQKQEADSINLEVIVPIIDMLYDYKIYDLGAVAYDNCWVIIQHSPLYIMNKYIKFVEELEKRKLVSKDSFMAYIDRLQVKQNKSQVFGWQHYRFPNGVMIQYPVLKKLKERWRDIKCESPPDSYLSSDYNVSYEAIKLSKSQYAIIGLVLDYSEKTPSNLQNIKVFADNVLAGTTDSNGYFQLIVDKKKKPKAITLLIDNKHVDYDVPTRINDDFVVSVGYYYGDTIDTFSN